jgi:DNA-directed RNA polymerase specialized sigma24 family protein
MREAQKQRRKDAGPMPPFWIRPEVRHGEPIDPRVVEASHRLWPWAYRYVELELQDGACAAELLEDVAIEVSTRMQVTQEISRNLNGYLITAFHNRVRAQLLKVNRLAYEGLLKELEENHRLAATDWTAALETQLVIRSLLSCLPHEVRHLLHYRMLGFSWKAIGRGVGISAKQAKKRFYYGVQRAYEELTKDQMRRAGQRERE